MTNATDPSAPGADDLTLDAARRALEDMSRRARLMIDTANDAIVTIDEASVIVDWNRTAERMFGWSRAEAVGRVLATLIVPERHRESHHRGLERFLRERHAGILNRRVETHALARDGREFDVELSVWPVEEGGRFTFSAFIRDISRRRQAEQALRDSEEKYRAVVENANEGIIVSQDGYLKFMNPRALALTGRSIEEAASTPFIEMVHPDDRARVYGNYLRRMRGESVENFYNFRVVTLRGETRWLQISAVAIQWEGRPATLNFLADVTDLERGGHFEGEWSLRRKDGTPWWCHLSARAINPERLAEAAWFFLRHLLAQARRGDAPRARARARALGAEDPLRRPHLARVPHAPRDHPVLRRAHGGLRPGAPRGRAPRALQAGEGRDRAHDQHARPGAAHRPRGRRPARVPPGAARRGRPGAGRGGRGGARRGGARARLGGRAQMGGERLLDEKLLRHTLSNLLSNAIKYSPPDAPVELEVESSREAVTFLVRDRGIGVPAEDQPRLFESFHRARNVGNIEGTAWGSRS